jgi:hypothetical protein
MTGGGTDLGLALSLAVPLNNSVNQPFTFGDTISAGGGLKIPKQFVPLVILALFLGGIAWLVTKK